MSENFVGITFFVLIIAGLALAMASNTRPKRSPASNRLQVGGLLTIALGFLWFGLLGAYFVRTSPRPTVVGTIGALQQHTGKYAGSDFTVIADVGEQVKIHCSYHGTGLQMGERIRVHYVQYDHNLLDADVLSGSVAGWHFAEMDQSLAAFCLSLFGLFGLYAAYSTNRKFILRADNTYLRPVAASSDTEDQHIHLGQRPPRGQR